LIYIPQHPLQFPLIPDDPPQFNCQFMSTAMIRMDQPGNTQVPANARARMTGAPSKVCYIITSLTIRMFLGHRHQLLYRIVRAKTPSPLMRPCPRCFEYLLNLPHLCLLLYHAHFPHYLLLPTFYAFTQILSSVSTISAVFELMGRRWRYFTMMIDTRGPLWSLVGP